MSYSTTDGSILIYDSPELRGVGLEAWHLHDLLWHAPGLTAFGIRRFRPAEALAWTEFLDLGQIEAALEVLQEAGAVLYDPDALQLFVTAKQKHNPVGSPKAAKGAVLGLLELPLSWAQIPACAQLIQRLNRMIEVAGDKPQEELLGLKHSLIGRLGELDKLIHSTPDTVSIPYRWGMHTVSGLGFEVLEPATTSGVCKEETTTCGNTDTVSIRYPYGIGIWPSLSLSQSQDPPKAPPARDGPGLNQGKG